VSCIKRGGFDGYDALKMPMNGISKEKKSEIMLKFLKPTEKMPGDASPRSL
jgi:hypothetical protein